MSSPIYVAKLISTESTRAVVEFEGNRIPISLALVPDAEIGDEVLVQNGFALRRMSEASEAAPGPELEFPTGDVAAGL